MTRLQMGVVVASLWILEGHGNTHHPNADTRWTHDVIVPS